MLNSRMQLGQIVERDARIHMMLHMVVHIPVEKAHERINQHCTGALTPVGRVRAKPDMLGKSTEGCKPGGDEAADIDHENKNPVTRNDKNSRR